MVILPAFFSGSNIVERKALQYSLVSTGLEKLALPTVILPASFQVWKIRYTLFVDQRIALPVVILPAFVFSVEN